MSEINILSSKIFNRIAAGEVVERPSSVVKELVENSIDAGADKITIEIVDGGITEIKIIDNGCGIEKNQLSKAILPHATSKISQISDLDAIKTLGFRGEALASIVSVSKFRIESKVKEENEGAYLYTEGGDNVEIFDCPCENGTLISVKNLFYNTPVRAKFLKTPKSEENEVSATVARFILGNNNIAFKYIVNGNVMFQSFGENFESAFICVYGTDALSNCHYIETEKNGIKICGYIGKPNFTKSNRSYQTVFLNGRYIVNQTISSSIANAYASYLMKRQYPFYTLSISIPNEYVDVNVHPNKIDVRFINNQIVYGAIYSVVSKVLDGSQEVLNIVVPEKKLFVESEHFAKKSADLSNNVGEIKQLKKDYSFNNLTFSDSNIFDKIEEKKEEKVEVNDIFKENKEYLEKLEKEKIVNQNNIITQTEIQVERELKVIGQALNTFLILEDGIDLYMIDQHAVHERLLFDKIIASISNKKFDIQPLLIPYIQNVNALEFGFLSSKLEYISEIGIDIEEFGTNSFKVSALPIYLANMNLKKFFDEILSDMNNLKNLTVKDILREKFAQKACKSAIKSGDKLDDSEIESLLKMMKNDLTLKCPHGRPVAIKITRNEIDKWFKRIV